LRDHSPNPRRNRNAFYLFALVLIFAARPLSAEVIRASTEVGGVKVYYVVVLPNGFNPGKTYPAVLAFPGGRQTFAELEGTLRGNWQQEAERRGYIVVIPTAPGGMLLYRGGEKIFPAFLTKILGDYKILESKFHIAGVSNGGISAFHIAAAYPNYFWSITGLPGYLPEATEARIHSISNMCVNMFVGELDSRWVTRVQEQAAQLRQQGLTVQFSIEKDQGHVMGTLEGAGAGRLFDQFEQARRQPCVK
jgi:poly(3-hydroxybutyrate) depolymerase